MNCRIMSKKLNSNSHISKSDEKKLQGAINNFFLAKMFENPQEKMEGENNARQINK